MIVKNFKFKSLINILKVVVFIFSAQVGSGCFILPSLLSASGYLSLLALIFVGLSAMFTISVFAESEKNIFHLIRNAFGNKFSKVLFFIYWFISWFSAIVLFKEMVGYLQFSGAYSFHLEFFIWFIITIINMWKLEYTLYIESILTVIKILPFFLLLFGYLMTPSQSIVTLEPLKVNLLLRCVWCFVGLETGSIIGSNLNVTSKERKFGTYIGMFLVIAFYLVSVIFSFKIAGNSSLLNNRAPYLTVLQIGLQNLFSFSTIQLFVKSLIVFSLIGSINSLILSNGYTAEECGKNGVLPKFLAVKNRNKVPYLGVFFSSFLVLVFLIICRSGDIYKIITMFIDISCCFLLAIYGLCLIAYAKNYCSKSYLKKFLYFLLGLIFLFIFFFELFRFF